MTEHPLLTAWYNMQDISEEDVEKMPKITDLVISSLRDPTRPLDKIRLIRAVKKHVTKTQLNTLIEQDGTDIYLSEEGTVALNRLSGAQLHGIMHVLPNLFDQMSYLHEISVFLAGNLQYMKYSVPKLMRIMVRLTDSCDKSQIPSILLNLLRVGANLSGWSEYVTKIYPDLLNESNKLNGYTLILPLISTEAITLDLIQQCKSYPAILVHLNYASRAVQIEFWTNNTNKTLNLTFFRHHGTVQKVCPPSGKITYGVNPYHVRTTKRKNIVPVAIPPFNQLDATCVKLLFSYCVKHKTYFTDAHRELMVVAQKLTNGQVLCKMVALRFIKFSELKVFNVSSVVAQAITNALHDQESLIAVINYLSVENNSTVLLRQMMDHPDTIRCMIDQDQTQQLHLNIRNTLLQKRILTSAFKAQWVDVFPQLINDQIANQAPEKVWTLLYLDAIEDWQPDSPSLFKLVDFCLQAICTVRTFHEHKLEFLTKLTAIPRSPRKWDHGRRFKACIAMAHYNMLPQFNLNCNITERLQEKSHTDLDISFGWQYGLQHYPEKVRELIPAYTWEQWTNMHFNIEVLAWHNEGHKQRDILAGMGIYPRSMVYYFKLPLTLQVSQMEEWIKQDGWDPEMPPFRIIDRLSQKTSKSISFEPSISFLNSLQEQHLDKLPDFMVKLDCTEGITAKLMEWLAKHPDRVEHSECPSCLDDLTLAHKVIRIVSCGHLVCDECLTHWVDSGRSQLLCPTCSQPMNLGWMSRIYPNNPVVINRLIALQPRQAINNQFERFSSVEQQVMSLMSRRGISSTRINSRGT